MRWSKPGPNIVSGGSADATKAVRGPQGAYWRLGLGPNRPRVGVPQAAAMCISPVSLPMNSAQRRSTAAAVSRSTRPTRSIRRSAGIASSSGSGLLALVAGGQHRDARSRQRAVAPPSAAAPARQSVRRAIACRASLRPGRSPAPGRRTESVPRRRDRDAVRSTAMGRAADRDRKGARAGARGARRHRPWPSPGVRRRAAARQGPSRADRRRYPSAGWRPHA